MPRVVLDTNVVVSALLRPDGLQDQVLRLALAGKLQLCLSTDVFEEYARVLPRARFKLRPAEIRTALAKIRAASILVHPTETLAVSKDEPDNRFLECADAAEAEYLVTGNTKHFPKTHQRTAVVNARQLLALLTESQE